MLIHHGVGIDVGTGTVKVAVGEQRFRFPSIVAHGFLSDWSEDTQIHEVGDAALSLANIRSISLKQPVHRGTPTNITDYLDLFKHALKETYKYKGDMLIRYPQNPQECDIVAGLPNISKDMAKDITKKVNRYIKPRNFRLISQSAGTLMNENRKTGIVCHIGHGTTEILVMINERIARAKTVTFGVGDMLEGLSASNDIASITKHDIFRSKDKVLAQQKTLLANNIQNILEKIVLEYRDIPLIFAGGGSLIPGLLDEIKSDIISNYITSVEPIYGNALGMLKVSKRFDTK